MTATNKTLVFSVVIRGFHVYRDVWNQHENEELGCLFEANNLFDTLQSEHVVRIVKKNSW